MSNTKLKVTGNKIIVEYLPEELSTTLHIPESMRPSIFRKAKVVSVGDTCECKQDVHEGDIVMVNDTIGMPFEWESRALRAFIEYDILALVS